MEYVRSFVLPGRHGAEPLECVYGALDFVPAGVPVPVEAGGATAPAATPLTVGTLIPALGDGVPDLPSAQVAAVSTRAVRLIAAHVVRSCPRVSPKRARDTDSVQDRNQLRCITPLPRRDQDSQRTAPALTGKMDLCREPAARATDRLIGDMSCRATALSRNPSRPVTGSGGMLVHAAHRGIHAHHAPVDPTFRVRVGLDSPQDSLPRAVRRPPAVTVMDRLPLPEPRGQVPPRNAGPQPEEGAVDDSAVILPPAPASQALWQVRLQSSPLAVRYVAPSHSEPNDPLKNPSRDPSDTS